MLHIWKDQQKELKSVQLSTGWGRLAAAAAGDRQATTRNTKQVGNRVSYSDRWLTLSVMSSEQEARRFPVGSHLIAFTSFLRENGR